MKRIGVSVLVGVGILLASGCSNDTATEATVPKPIEVTFEIPKEVDTNKEEKLMIHVTQGTKNVNDADEVKFEIWKAGTDEKSELIKATAAKKGMYAIQHRFSEAGVYFVQTHVTAHDMHNMPKTYVVAGDVPKEEVEKLTKDMDKEKSQHMPGHH